MTAGDERFSLTRFLAARPDLRSKLGAIKAISSRVRTNAFQLTRECNLRCQGCWYYANKMDEGIEDQAGLDRIREILEERLAAGITHALVVGGEPAIYPERLAVFARTLPFLSVATNGYRKIPRDGFEEVSIGLALFAGYRSDDAYRAIAAGGQRFEGLFRRGLDNYRDDERVTVVYALSEEAIDEIAPSVDMIEQNGNLVYFSYYRHYGEDPAETAKATEALLERALEVAQRYPGTVLSHPYYIESLIRGETPWGRFGYDGCATISSGHPANATRLSSGRPILPGFESYAQDLTTRRLCCASGDCANCRDSLALSSWLLVNFKEHVRDAASLENWIGFADSYWRGFAWSPLHRSKAGREPAAARGGEAQTGATAFVA
ncbi:hypothetical protein SAMN06265365_14710 [Tistlia consotensis]|uniref:Radical SAM protein n=1 Tax=Tistlia consotensis USBA 355 TaxID=560819 RepID=A0A1Y6CLY3_9PROT|nr:radical SAM protein [Tistlia consotensis]SMF73482.1 hypothetical protein SAMN05428998_13222 [Tistlia consotensis USBA 355]SNS30275.1 hypothetical protein SAMN06265365_14710 [Tistlia consotensis]